ncbi:amidohydrolase family protein [Sphaerochaeta sp. PS]|uniref:amidohydrolase family protein n=1 Tax=Sphaerochaeta sp. PS TaxID=3076336 RepID=UPI0028A3F1FC|nr:amidohydrolase family protein [Sphaerochaeta sp. PS]MDT4763298.1 amidohydrolase family protein [Sphaerochaeta sp. PS]
MNYFFDQHFHVMNIEHPNLLSFFASLDTGIPDLITSGALSPNYILTGKNLKGSLMLNRITNTLTTFEQPIGETLAVMEDDLEGKFTSHEEEAPKPDQPYIREGKMHMRSQSYDKLAMCPQLMDFSSNEISREGLYYPSKKTSRILKYAEDTLAGFDLYRKDHPEGLFEFFPFIGITPPTHSIEFIEELLETYVTKTHSRQGQFKEGKQKFYGVKFYPPLGYNPWPSDQKERDKVTLIYDFCTKYDVPIMTHCDDQGFRGISPKEAWKYTSPATYKPVLEAYPTLRIDFAHYGWQYNPLHKKPLTILTAAAAKVPDSPWFFELVELMHLYPNVYADFSFSGTNSDFYILLDNYIKTLDEMKAETVLSRSLFGSDFNVNLLKVESYTSYYRMFELSPFADENIHRFVQTNPMAYMGIVE